SRADRVGYRPGRTAAAGGGLAPAHACPRRGEHGAGGHARWGAAPELPAAALYVASVQHHPATRQRVYSVGEQCRGARDVLPDGHNRRLPDAQTLSGRGAHPPPAWPGPLQCPRHYLSTHGDAAYSSVKCAISGRGAPMMRYGMQHKWGVAAWLVVALGLPIL